MGWVEVAEQTLWGELSLHSPDYRSPKCGETDAPLASVKEIILLPNIRIIPSAQCIDNVNGWWVFVHTDLACKVTWR